MSVARAASWIGVGLAAVVVLVFAVLLPEIWAGTGLPLVIGALAAAALLVLKTERVTGVATAVARFAESRPAQAFLLVVCASMVLLIAIGFGQGRILDPLMHDQESYRLQSVMLARGRLWTASPPAPGAFESFHIFTTPVYASIYPPGNALLQVPGVWLGLPVWGMPVLIASVAAGLLCLVTTRLTNGLLGLAAPTLLVTLFVFRYAALTNLAQVPVMMLSLGALFCVLRWIDTGRLGWAGAAGALGGWAGITRPVDAIVFGLPVLVLFLLHLRRRPLRQAGAAMGLSVACALPLLGLQVVQNVGTTGSPWQTPYGKYIADNHPNSALGWHTFDPALRPRTTLPQKLKYYEVFVAPMARAHTPQNAINDLLAARLPIGLMALLGSPVAVFPFIVGVIAAVTGGLPGRSGAKGLGRAHRRQNEPDLQNPAERQPDQPPPDGRPPDTRPPDERGTGGWVLVATIPLFFLAYWLYIFFFAHYVVPFTAASTFAVVLGLGAVARLHPRVGRAAAVAVFVALLTAGSLRAVTPLGDELYPGYAITHDANLALDQAITPPALLLVEFNYQTDDPHGELVYNSDYVHPTDAPVIRAHLRPDSVEPLMHYFATRDPQRSVYLLDREHHSLTLLGPAVGALPALQKRLAQMPASSFGPTSPSMTNPAKDAAP